MGNMHYRALYVTARYDYGNANRSWDHEDGDAPSVSLPGSSGSSSDVADTRRKGQDRPGMPAPPVGDTVQSSTPLAVKPLSRLKVPMCCYLLGRQTRGRETLKSGAPDDENLHVAKFKKTRLGGSESKSIKGVVVGIGRDPKGDNCEKQISKRLRAGSMAGGGSQNVMDETVEGLLAVSK